jgi:hypothetical protein
VVEVKNAWACYAACVVRSSAWESSGNAAHVWLGEVACLVAACVACSDVCTASSCCS